jgi:hypothetical protein
MISSWDETRKRSKYHFDTTSYDPKYDTIVNLGYIIPFWQNDIETIIETSKQVSWRTRGDPNKPSRPESELSAEEYDLEKTGYGADYKISNLNWNIPDKLVKLAESFGFEKMMCRVHVQQPGQVWNLHLDKLEKWCPENPNSVMRVMIQLTDWQQGQFWSYGNYLFTGWKAGDVTTFDWQNVPHSTANASHYPRVTLQVTGIKTFQTTNFLNLLSSATQYKFD